MPSVLPTAATHSQRLTRSHTPTLPRQQRHWYPDQCPFDIKWLNFIHQWLLVIIYSWKPSQGWPVEYVTMLIDLKTCDAKSHGQRWIVCISTLRYQLLNLWMGGTSHKGCLENWNMFWTSCPTVHNGCKATLSKSCVDVRLIQSDTECQKGGRNFTRIMNDEWR